MGADAPAINEKMIPVMKIGKFDFVVKKKRARHGALAKTSEAVASLAGSEIFAESALLVPEMGRLLGWRFCLTAGGMGKVSQLPYVLCLRDEHLV